MTSNPSRAITLYDAGYLRGFEEFHLTVRMPRDFELGYKDGWGDKRCEQIYSQ